MKTLKQYKGTRPMHNLDIPTPEKRMRRLRANDTMRRFIRETHLNVNDLIYPIFVEENTNERVEIKSMPGVFRETETTLVDKVKECDAAGIPAIILFGVSKHKDSIGSDSMQKTGLLSRMIQIAKQAAPNILVIADVCFCEYTDHGHCGPLNDDSTDVDNDRTLENLASQAVNAARAGADIIAPSGMMDGGVEAIRSGLNQSGFNNLPIMAYAAKFASGFYGPFRDAAGCSLGGSQGPKDRKTYQMDPANRMEALREVEQDIMEGADMVMVKPGLPYLDVIREVKDTFQMPTFAYNVSGEYAMLKFAAQAGAIDYDVAMMESLMCFKRAGADGIITYHALEAAELLRK
jgi:porphobilinogen synthase